MIRKRTALALAFAIASAAFLVAGFDFLVHGPQTLIPTPGWPFTAEARKSYDPLGEHSRRTVSSYIRQKLR